MAHRLPLRGDLAFVAYLICADPNKTRRVRSLATQRLACTGRHVAAGLNNNAYQITRGEHFNKQAGHDLASRCNFVKGDFMKMPFTDQSYDGIYQIEATCHAPDAVAVYKVTCLLTYLLTH